MRLLIVLTLLAVLAVPLRAFPPDPQPAPDLTGLQETFDRIVRETRAQVGVTLIHVESGAQISVNGDRRFPMASVYKLPIVVELFKQAFEGKVALDQIVTIGPSDVRPCCTISQKHPNGGTSLTLLELADMMLTVSDNTASDALLKVLGGPSVVQARLNSMGFPGINITRYEGDALLEMAGVTAPPPKDQWTLDLQRRLVSEVDKDALSEARIRYRNDPRDATTPDEMARFLVSIQKGELLPPTYTSVLLNLMSRAKTGPTRLRGPLPPETIVAHKTGTTEIVCNDVGIITLPDDSAIRGHIAIAVFVANGNAGVMDRAIARLSASAFEFFTGKPLPVIEAPKPAQSKAKVTAPRGRRSTASSR